MPSATSPAADRTRILFVSACLAIFTAGVSASLRSAIASSVKAEYVDAIDPVHAGGMIGAALGVAFLGWSISLFFCSLLLERIGMKAILLLASALFAISNLLIIFCGDLAHGPAVYSLFYFAILLNGFGWGCVEGTINPLIAALYPDDVTGPMNRLHAWWPAGLILGSLFGVFSARIGIDWRWTLAVVPVLSVAFGALAFGQRFPSTVSVAMGVSTKDRLLEILRRPTFFIWMALMLLTSATELSPGQWVDVALTNVVGMRGVLLLAYVAGIQFIGRHFAGPLSHRLCSEGLLTISSLLACIGLYGLSMSHGPVSALLSATAWGLGICFIWPTMLAVAAERYPRGGAWAIGLLGVAGALSNYFVLPLLGKVYDEAAAEAASGQSLTRLTAEQLSQVQTFAASRSFEVVAILPAILVIIFSILWFQHRKGRGAGLIPVSDGNPS